MRYLALFLVQIALSFPLVARIDEQPVSDVIYGAAPGYRDYPQIASDGENFLVVWQDHRAWPPVVYAARVSREGELLDATGIRIPIPGYSAVVFLADAYWILWTEARNLYATRLSREGELIETRRLLLSEMPNATFTVASSASRLIVLSRDRFSLFSAEGKLLHRDVPIPVSATPDWTPHVASNGAGFLIAWVNSFTPKLQSWLFDAEGRPVGSINAISVDSGLDVALAANGRDYILIYSNNTNRSVESRSISGDGMHIGAPVPLPQVPFGAANVALSWNGAEYLAFWGRSVSLQSGGPQALRRIRIDADGKPLDEATQTVVSAFAINWPAAASNGRDVLVVWRGQRQIDDYSSGIYAAKGSGAADANFSGMLLSRSATEQGAPSIAFSGQNYLVARRERSAVYFNRIALTGEHLDGAGTFVSPVARGIPAMPRVIFDGENYVLAWIADGTLDGVGPVLRVARVQPDSGTVLDVLGTVVEQSGGVSSFDLASNENGIAIAWSDGRIHAARFNSSLQTLDIRHDLSPKEMSAGNPAVAWNGTEWLIAFDEQFFYYGGIVPPLLIRANLRGVHLSPLFNLLDPEPMAIAANTSESNVGARLASNGNEFAIAWTGGVPGQSLVRARHMKSGSFLDDVVVLANGTASSIVWDSNRYAVAYESKRSDHSSDALLTHLGSAGNPLPRDQMIISATPDDETSPRLVSIGGGNITASYIRVATEPLYGGVARAFVRDPIPVRSRPVRMWSDPSIVQPKCADPAPLSDPNHRAYPGRLVDDYVVLLKFGFNVNVEGPRLAQKHQLTIQEFFTIIPAFGASLHAETVAALRCEPSVENVEFSHTNIPPP